VINYPLILENGQLTYSSAIFIDCSIHKIHPSIYKTIWWAVRLWWPNRLSVYVCACPVKCLPSEMRSLFHNGETYVTGVVLRAANLSK